MATRTDVIIHTLEGEDVVYPGTTADAVELLRVTLADGSTVDYEDAEAAVLTVLRLTDPDGATVAQFDPATFISAMTAEVDLDTVG